LTVSAEYDFPISSLPAVQVARYPFSANVGEFRRMLLFGDLAAPIEM
tara:strand:- start:193 stop:333 length:141 start_codon:yes stop_codon:yes gene_type:complete